MTYENVIYETSDHLATVTLNRPERLNAWTGEMEKEVRDAMAKADADPNVRVIILTGAGRGFCAGAEMNNLADMSSRKDGPEERSLRVTTKPYDPRVPADYQTQYSYLLGVTKPIIGAINGPVAGMGLAIVLFTDIRFASENAVFTTAFARRGLIAEHGLSWTLPRLVGHSNALDLLMTARKVTAKEAEKMGLVSRVIPQDTFMQEVRAYAKELAALSSPRSTRIIKKQVYEALNLTLAEAIGVANTEMIESLKTDDFKEGVAHFLEKRPPEFTGT